MSELTTASGQGPVPSSTACLYSAYFPMMIEKAKEFGYALCLHGSLKRDMDLVAVPWVEDAAEPLTLVMALKELVGGYTKKDLQVEQKPHGRVAYVIYLHFNMYFDISVMPKVNQQRMGEEYETLLVEKFMQETNNLPKAEKNEKGESFETLLVDLKRKNKTTNTSGMSDVKSNYLLLSIIEGQTAGYDTFLEARLAALALEEEPRTKSYFCIYNVAEQRVAWKFPHFTVDFYHATKARKVFDAFGLTPKTYV